MPTVREALGPLDLLEALDWLRPAVIRHGQEGGRPRTVYETNPKLRRGES